MENTPNQSQKTISQILGSVRNEVKMGQQEIKTIPAQTKENPSQKFNIPHWNFPLKKKIAIKYKTKSRSFLSWLFNNKEA